MEIYILSALLKEKIWGGDYFKQLGKTKINNVGEMWSASAHPNGESIIMSGKYANERLSSVYKKHPELFNYPCLKEFPILVKLINSKDDLSIQVHPDDEYALKNENQYGKTEGWLILNKSEGAKLLLGHKAKNKEELIKYISENNYEELLNSVDVKVGQFFPIYAGTIHGIGAGLTILEIQQSSDVTYRLYDYKRKDENGNERELQVEKAISVITYNEQKIDETNHLLLSSHVLWDNIYFTVSTVDVSDYKILEKPVNYAIFTVVVGEFIVDGNKIMIGDSFILSKLANKVLIKGSGILIRTDAK